MNIFQKAYLAFRFERWMSNSIKEAKKVNNAKPGWKTTEFWGKIAVQVLAMWGMAKGFMPEQYAVIGTIGLEALYNIGRIVIKAMADYNAAKSS